ncbi:hypothetical protein FRIGORI9N_310037 [Frigoribacterium sp. 9N]|nr:hypothetical protein FRIGORI9N_310037 [Frigoribacterium sp. 9N]
MAAAGGSRRRRRRRGRRGSGGRRRRRRRASRDLSVGGGALVDSRHALHRPHLRLAGSGRRRDHRPSRLPRVLPPGP